jgi:uncharacterized protein YbjT (DUF2867 family)
MPLAGAEARFSRCGCATWPQALVRCLQDNVTIGQTYELCGPEVHTLRELVRAGRVWAGVRGGRGRPIIGLPAALARLQALPWSACPASR